MTSGSKLLVRQIKEWTEIFTGFETKNRYGVYGADGARELAFIAEESGALGRFFLARSRACTLHVYDAARREIARIEKPFTWFLHEMAVVEQDRPLGSVERRLTELFTTADTFGLEFTARVSDDLRKLLLAATMLVDFCYFEDRG